MFLEKGQMSMHDISAALLEKATELGAPKSRAPKGASATEDHSRSRLRCAATLAEEKRFLVDEMWRLRHIIQREKASRTAHECSVIFVPGVGEVNI